MTSDVIDMDGATAVEVLRSTALAELSAVDLGIAALRDKYADANYDVSTTKGMDAAKRARLDIRERRYKVPHIVKAQKEVLTQISRDIDSEGDRITQALLALETPIHNVIKAEEDRKAEEKAERERVARERAERIQRDMDTMRDAVLQAVGTTPERIQQLMDSVLAVDVTVDAFGDRAGEAMQLKLQTGNRLADLKAQAEAAAVLQAQLEEQRAALRRAEEARKASEELERQVREAAERAQREEADRLQREAADQLAQERAAFERQQQEAVEERAREQKRLNDERAALEAEREAERQAVEQARRQAEQDRREQEQREADERAAREAKDKAAQQRMHAASPLMLEVLTSAFAMLERGLLVDTFGAEWVEKAERAMAMVAQEEVAA
ncbi:hypothetical protein C8245_23050 [Paracidovorax avenae]|uniref:hypothetical protein n=1 Tax=Paracidovorax avenae TaxID=80867 RepID=UPI000D207DF7|nr:hypothetical protein [Paracidovorax avenae]AVS68155.1 hypothetical protein C8245_23050 [Paracidovorax avenae]